MRVLYLTNGQTPHDLRFATALAGTTHDVHVLSLQGITTGWPEQVHVVNWEPVEKNWLRVQLQVPRLKAVIRELAPDVIHAGPMQWPAFLAAAAGAHPLVSMSWGSDLLVEAKRNLHTRRITSLALARTDVLVGDSKCILESARSFGYKGPYFQFPWGVDLAHFAPGGVTGLRKRLGWEQDTVLLSVRSFESLYDVDTIVSAFCQASQVRSDLRLLVYGAGSRENVLRRKVEAAGMTAKVHFGGMVGLQELPEVYRSADLYVSASHSDGASVSLMEALACGLPALVSDIPGNREWIEPGVNGWRFGVGDAEELSSNFLRFDKDSIQTTEMKARNRLLAEQRADWTKNFPILLQAYEQAIELNRGRK